MQVPIIYLKRDINLVESPTTTTNHEEKSQLNFSQNTCESEKLFLFEFRFHFEMLIWVDFKFSFSLLCVRERWAFECFRKIDSHRIVSILSLTHFVLLFLFN